VTRALVDFGGTLVGMLSRRQMRQRSALIALALSALAASVPQCLAASATADAKSAAMAIDANTGAILHAQSADAPRYPASLTKMMTLYMLFERMEQGQLNADTKLKLSQEATSVAPSKLDLEPGEEIAVADAVRALITKSANDVAVAIAERLGGTEVAFARMMTERAHQIGMTSTTFRNASGLPNAEQVTTARDMLTLALRLQDDFPRYYYVFATKSFAYNGSTHKNHNSLLFNYQGADGIKTGYTRASGFNLVSSVRRDGKHVVAVVFGGKTAGSRNASMRLLLNRALDKASTEKNRKPMLVASPKPAKRRDQKFAAAEPQKPAKTTAAKSAAAPAPAVQVPAAAPKPEIAPAAVREPTAPAPNAVATAQPANPTPIQIAKVRRVLVAPRAQPTAAAPPPPAQPAMAATAERPRFATASASPGLDINALLHREPQGSPPSPDEDDAAQSPVRQAGTLQMQMAAIASNMVPANGQTAATFRQPELRPSIASDSPVLTQAARLGAPPPAVVEERYTPPPAPTKPAATVASTTKPGGFLIQVGAFGTEAEATRHLSSIRQQAANVLTGVDPVTQVVQKGDRQLFRARFAGFDANRAASACFELRRLQFDCFVMKE